MMTPTKSKLCNPGELKKPRQSRYFLFLLPLALAACSSMPSGPNVMVLPGKGVSFEQFRADDLLCRQYAASQTGTNSNDAAINSGVKSAAVGTALGAAGGALIDGGHGAAVGAGVGLVFGGLTGAGSGTTSSYHATTMPTSNVCIQGATAFPLRRITQAEIHRMLPSDSRIMDHLPIRRHHPQPDISFRANNTTKKTAVFQPSFYLLSV